MDNRRDFFAAFGAAMLAAGAQSAHAKVADAVLGLSEAQALTHPFGVQHIYYQGPTDMLEYFEGRQPAAVLRHGAASPHRHPEEEILLVASGEGEISVDGEIKTAGPGAIMFTAAEKLHGIKNTGSEPLLFD